nr:hypothetical protein [Tanacetum cinerariifolium]
MISILVFVDLEISTQADEAQSFQVLVQLPNDPYKAIRQAYLVGTDDEFDPFEDPVETETPESPYTIAPPTCHVRESEGSGMSGARSTSLDSIATLSLDHPLTHTSLVLVPSLHMNARMAMRILPVMSPSFSVNIAEVAVMPDSSFRKRFSKGDELGEEEDEDVEESSYSDSESEDEKDEGPTVMDEDPAAEAEGLAARDEGPDMGVEILGLGGDEAVPEGQQLATLVVETAVGEHLRLGYGALKRQEIASREGQMPSVFEIVASPAMAEVEGFLVELGAHIEMHRGLIHDHTLVLALEAWAGCVDTRMENMLRAEYDDHRLVYGMLLQQATLQQELQEMRGRVTALEQERDHTERKAANTATSLDTEQDRGNIFNTQSKATPNEPGSQGTSSGGGPRCQETIRDVVAQTRSERVSKISYDPLLTRVNTPQSDEGLVKEDASKRERIANIDSNKDIYLVNVQNDKDMFGVNDLDGDEVIVENVDVTDQAKEVVDDITLAKALMKIKNKVIKKVNTFVDFKTELVEESSKKAKAEITQEGSLKRAGDKLEQERSKKQKVEDDKESKELKKFLEIIPDDGDDVTIDATHLSSKSLTIVNYKIYQEGKKREDMEVI